MNKKFIFIFGTISLIIVGSVFYTVYKGRKEHTETAFAYKQETVEHKTGKNDYDINRGYKIFQENCQVCHGINAQGQNPNQRNGGRDKLGNFIAPALNGTAHAWHHNDELLFQIVKEGSPDPNSPMKGFEGRLSDEEIKAVISFLKAMWPEEIRNRHRKMQM